jgi:response regulator RpfG family c-di-GMP phosphodiesterase/DNA-binding CsgD family transcriptional regulator
MAPGVIEALGQIYERWDGKGSPLGARGDAVRRVARVLHISWRIAAHGLLEGRAAASAVIAERAGSEFDPALAATAIESMGSLVAGFDAPSVWELYLDEEPRPWLHVGSSRVADVALAFGQYVDIKSPYTLTHSTGIAELAKDAARLAGQSSDEQADIVIAALLHDLGRVSIANGIWDKPHKLGAREWEIVRGHTYETERILGRSPLLARYAKTASLHHERLDGSGYHRSAQASALDRASRLLAAADVYHALTEERAHRPALPANKAADTVMEEARAGRLCRDAVEAVLASAGHRKTRARGSYPAQLSDREVEVIALVARGLSNKEVAARLSISHKTVQRHMESIFAKTGLRSRAAAAVFAVDQRLLRADD